MQNAPETGHVRKTLAATHWPLSASVGSRLAGQAQAGSAPSLLDPSTVVPPPASPLDASVGPLGVPLGAAAPRKEAAHGEDGRRGSPHQASFMVGGIIGSR